MKLSLFFVAVVLLFSSCAQILFTVPQPQKGMVIKAFIDEIQGNYSDSILSVAVHKNELVISGESYRLTNKLPGNGEVLVKFYKNQYFANFSDSVYYSVIMGKFYDNKLAIYMLSPDERTVGRLRNFGEITVLDSVNKTYLLDASKKQFEQLVDYEMFDVVHVLEKE